MSYRLFVFTFASAMPDALPLLHDLLPNLLGDVGFDSFEPTAKGLHAYLPATELDEATLHKRIVAAIGYATDIVPTASISYEECPFEQQNWNAAWEAQWIEPYIINTDTQSLYIVPDGYSLNLLPKDSQHLTLSPHCSFGLGDHPTTAMILQQLLTWGERLRGLRVLDMGCGTGVLALYALQCGAASAIAIDIDPWSTEATHINATLNATTTPLDIRLGSIEQTDTLSPASIDLLFANIHRNILAQHLPRYAELLAPSGTLFLSGFYLEDVATLIAQGETLGLTHNTTHGRKGWEATGTWACIELVKL